MRAVWAVIKSVTECHRLGQCNYIRLQTSKFRRVAFIVRPPTIGISGIISRGEVCKIALDSTLSWNVGRNAAFDGVPFGLACRVGGEENGWLYPVGREISGLRTNGGITIWCALQGGIWDRKN